MSFTSYPIYFNFRDRQRTALVHQYGTHELVYTSDIEIIKEFGGCIKLEGARVTSYKQAADAKELHMAITAQIR